MSEISAEIVERLAAFAELPIPQDRLPILTEGLAAMADLLAQLDAIDLEASQPLTIFSAEWEE